MVFAAAVEVMGMIPQLPGDPTLGGTPKCLTLELWLMSVGPVGGVGGS